jgi:prolyl oligopeptidase
MRALCLAFLAMSSIAAIAGEYPETRREVVVDSYHVVEVADPYQWLEDWSSAEVKAWSAAQNEAARAQLDALPHRKAIAQRVEAVMGGDTTSYYSAQRVGDQAWFIKYAPPKQQPYLVQIHASGDADSERIVFDPEKMDESGSTSIEWFRVSPDGKRVAIALTVAGAETADLHIFDNQTGQQVDAVVPRVNGPTAGGDLAWDADSAGFYYTRYPREGEKASADMNFFQQLWHRRLATPLEEDRYEIGELFDRIAEIRVIQHLPSGKVLVTMQYGDSGRFQLYVRNTDGGWHRVADYDDRLVQATFIDDNALLVLSRKDTPRGAWLQMDISELPAVKLEKLISPGEFAFASDFYYDPPVVVHGEKIYAKTLVGGPEELRVYALDGTPLPSPDLGISGVGQILPWDDGVLLRQYSYLAPTNWLLFDGKRSSRHPLSSTSPVSFEGAVVERKRARSKDGTEVPVSIIMAEGTRLDGSSPLLLTGYGGYGISLSPGFNPIRKLWLEQGGIIAIANLRGGGEFGDEWHRQGMLTNKQNVFDDFHGVMKYLVEAGYTSRDKLAIEGGSNGGLLMGAMITQHPGDFAAVISHVGIYDSLRVELSPNGAFNIPEFGTVKDPDQFRALRAYSPYHNVASTAYPPILFMTGENDGRVDPMHSRKMTAMLQANTTSGKPILLRTSGNTGHGSGTPYGEAVSQQVDRLVFLFDSLGMAYGSDAKPEG